ncbi:hypothetical protein [uncultured Clostridium sp.]|uniref:hypothetical protein n=1 Tax=uncultured Clostridium sp. TaxID=59620 RepID=UPI0026184FB6|nr:hypothetical protein [uncultured Clostridium sp.]
MLKINKRLELRKLIKENLKTLGIEIFYEKNNKKEPKYPYIVYEIEESSFMYIEREDSILTINVWDKNDSTQQVENLAKAAKDMFLYANIPTETILPTFYLENILSIQDEDKQIKRRQLRIKVEMY